jgi:hypothetical protein
MMLKAKITACGLLRSAWGSGRGVDRQQAAYSIWNSMNVVVRSRVL